MNSNNFQIVMSKAGSDLKQGLQSLVSRNEITLDDISTQLLRQGGRVLKRETTFYTFEDRDAFRFRIYRAPPIEAQDKPKQPAARTKSPNDPDSNQTETLIYLLFVRDEGGDPIGYVGNTTSLNKRLLSHQRDDVLPGAKNGAEIYAFAKAKDLPIYLSALDLTYDKRLVPLLRASWLQHLTSVGVKIPSIKRMPKVAYTYDGPEIVTPIYAAQVKETFLSAPLSIGDAIQSDLNVTDLYQRLIATLPNK